MAQDQRGLRPPSLLAWLIPCFRKRRGYQLIPLAPNFLSALPVELILAIAGFMPPNDLICFSLCDHRLFSLLHKTTAPRLGRDLTLELLQRLERDLPNHFACQCCITIHPYYRVTDLDNQPMYSSMCLLRCVVNSAWHEPRFRLSIHGFAAYTMYEFSFLHLQLAMKRFNGGLRYGITPEKLSYIEVQENYEPKCTTLFSIETKVCTDPLGLYLRIQDIVLFKDQAEDFFRYPDRHNSRKPPHVFMVCTHFRFSQMKEQMNPLLSAYKQTLSPIRLERTCEKCNADFLLELQEFDGYSAFSVTRWISLGSGLTPEDPLWRIRSLQNTYDGLMSPFSMELDKMAWSPRRSYESSSGDWTQETLLSRNLSWLKGKRYKRCMHSDGTSTWLFRHPEFSWAQKYNRKIR